MKFISRLMNMVSLEKLFSDLSGSADILNYVFVLVRVGGMDFLPDPLLTYKGRLEKKEKIIPTPDDLENLFRLIFNLLGVAVSRPYEAYPFSPDEKDLRSMVSRLVKIAKEDARVDLAEEIERIFDKDALQAVEQKSEIYNFSQVNDFFGEVLSRYFEERLKAKGAQKLYKLDEFQVLEVLTNEAYGLHGFNIYFSNGTRASVERHAVGTTGQNVWTTRGPVTLMVGDPRKMKREWMIGEKRLYEVGLPGRYNAWGEWRPLIYPGDTSGFEKEVRALADGDHQVNGALFYIMCTGHRIIEFVAKTPIEMPAKKFSLGDRMHFYKCDPLPEYSHAGRDFALYDGHFEIDDISYEGIRAGLAAINVGLNRMAFAYNSTVEWCLKYDARPPSTLKPTPTEEDVEVLNQLLVNFPINQDQRVLDMALDWFHRGQQAKRSNVFVAFLCYYIALESVATAVVEKKASLGLAYKNDESQDQRRVRISEEIQALYDRFYAIDPEEFARKAYFDATLSLGRRTRQVAELVFGADHPYISALFEKSEPEKLSLSDLRHKMAHGSFTLLSGDHQRFVARRLPEMEEICSAFLKMVIFKPGGKIPQWSGSHEVAGYPSDPRYTRVASTDQIFFGHQDWRIRPEWLC